MLWEKDVFRAARDILLQKDLESRYEALWRSNLLLRPANLHESADAQGCIANRNFAANNRCLFEGTRSNEANTALTDVLHAARQRTDLGVFCYPEEGQFADHHFEALGEPHFMTPIGLADFFHVSNVYANINVG